MPASDEPALPTVALVGPGPDSRGGIAAAIDAIARSGLERRFRLLTVATHRSGGRGAKAAGAAAGLLRLAWLLARRRADLVHLHVSTGGSLARKAVAFGLARAARRPIVLHLHAGGAAELLAGSRSGLQRRALVALLERADAVVVLTAGWAETVSAAARVRRLAVVANAPDTRALPAPAEREPDGTVLYLGHLYRRKGVYELVEAVARVRERRPGVRLVLGGEGPEENGLRDAIAARPGLRDAVELAGWVGPERKRELLAGAACLALPSYAEGLPLTLLEAMAAGLPVVATAVGGIPEVVREGEEALLVPPRDAGALAAALERVLADDELARRLAAAALARQRREYSVESLAERLGRVYDELLERRPRGPDGG